MRLIRRFFRFLLGLVRGAVWVVGLVTIVVAGWFFVAERPVPRETLTRLLDAVGTDSACLDARDASIGLREGLVLRQVRLLPKRLADPPWLTADELRVVASVRPGRPPREWLESVIVHTLTVPALPAAASLGATSNAAPLHLSSLPPMRFDIVDANFAGMRFKRLQGCLRQEAGATIVEDVKITWPGDRWPEEAHGSVRYDSATGHLEGQVSGHTVPERLYPLFRMLHANDVETICRRFAFRSAPATVETTFLVAPERARTELRVTLSVDDCIYSGVPVRHANTVITAEGSNGFDRVDIRPLVCERDDGTLSGGLTYDCVRTNLEVLAQSDMPVLPLLRIVGLPASLAPRDLAFAAPPRLTIAGLVSLEGSSDFTRLDGTLAAATATVYRLPVQDLRAEFGIVSNRYTLRGVRASVAGGEVTGDFALLTTPGSSQTAYRTEFRVRDVSIETLSAAFGVTNPPPGKASGDVELDGRLGPEADRNLHGQGDIKLEKGVISRIPLFAGFTDYLARNVPGVESLVSQSEARLPFAITNGVLRSDGVLVEGSVFSLAGKGTYSFPGDQLDFAVQASIFKRRSWLGTISRIVTLPFAKLLMEFRVTGPIGHPAWEYRGIIERILDSVGDAVGGKKGTPL